MAFEWVAGLFQSEEARGLSGESAASVALDESNPFYNYCLRRHQADGDLIQDPGLLWFTSPYVNQRQGLGVHCGSEINDGVTNYTDALLILSDDDYDRADLANSNAWLQDTTRLLRQEFANECTREKIRTPHTHRPLGFQVIRDGSEEMNGIHLGLDSGEFVTGLVSNLYTGPVEGSFPVIGIHVNLPGVWEGYKEIGRLHNDQLLFTLGNHWLDNFSHPSLREGALYRLQWTPGGKFRHIVNPDLQDRYQYVDTTQNGTRILTLKTREGVPLAYIVLTLIEPPASRPSEPTPPKSTAKRPGISMPVAPEKPEPVQHADADSIPSVAPPMLLDDEVGPVNENLLGAHSRTIIPEGPSERIFTLQERGAMLQKVHFGAFMLGYDVHFGRRGELGTKVEDPAATFQIRKKTTSLLSHVDGLTVSGQSVSAGQSLDLKGNLEIEYSGTRLEFRDQRGNRKMQGWPYVAELRRPASSTYLIWGEEYRVGRSRECRVVLPDNTNNENIHWKPNVGDGAYIRSRTGSFPKAKFYTDSIMVSSEHATVDLRDGEPKLTCSASHCYVFVRREDEVLTLHPTSQEDAVQDVNLRAGDEVLIGNCLFQVGFADANDVDAPTTGDRPKPHSADSLADSVPEPVFFSEPPASDVISEAPSDPFDVPKSKLVDTMELQSDFVVNNSDDEENQDDDGADETQVHGRPSQDSEAIDSSPMQGLEPTEPAEQAEATFNSEFDDSIDFGSARQAAETTSEEEVLEEVPEDPEEGAMADTAQPPPEIVESLEKAPSQVVVPTPFPDIDGPSMDAPAPPDEAKETPEDEEPADPASAQDNTAGIVYTDDTEAQFELGRPVHVILAGWMVNGEVTLGNHSGANLILPENRIVESQKFTACDYLKIKIRGRKGQLRVLARSELLVDENDPTQETYDNLEGHIIDVIRRDDAGEEDFAVRLTFQQDRSLPDPRARFVALDYEDPLAAALVTRGLPRGTSRTLELGPITMDFLYSGSSIEVTNYLDTYRDGDAFRPFFVQRDGKRFKTAPEDGSPIALSDGDRMVVGQAVYIVREE